MEALLKVGLGNAAGAALLALLVALIGRYCRRPCYMHALWLLVLVKLVTPPLWPVPIEIPMSAPSHSQVEVATLPPAQLFTPIKIPLDASPPAPIRVEPEIPNEPSSGPIQAQLEAPVLAVLPHFSSPEPEASRWQWTWVEVTALIWAVGTFMYWTLAGVRVARFCRAIRNLHPAPAELQERSQGLAGRIGLQRAPLVCLLDAPISPMVWAFGRKARLLLPTALWNGLTDVQRDLLLTHELAHLRRRDHWVRLFELLVVGLYWWLPIAWWARLRLQESAENCCDAYVLSVYPEAAPEYANTLVDSAEFLSRRCLPLPVGASGIGRVHLLRRRLTMILKGKIPHGLSWASFALLVIGAAVVLPLWPTQAEPPEVQTTQIDEVQAITPAKDSANEAEEYFKFAQFYEKTGYPGSAHIYYEIVMKQYPETPWAAEAEKKLHDLQTAAEKKGLPVQPPPKSVTPGQPGLPAAPANPQVPPPPAKVSAREIQGLRDEIDLLKVKLQMDMAKLQLTQTERDIAQRRWDVAKETHKKGAAPESLLLDAQQEFATRDAAVKIQQAQVQYVELQLGHAQRRLNEIAGVLRPAPSNKGRTSAFNAEKLFDHLSRDLGVVKRGETAKDAIALKNYTKGRVEIETFRTSHALLSVTFQPEGKSLNPGETGVLTIFADTARVEGPLEGALFVTMAFYDPDTNQVANRETVKLTIKLNSKGPPPVRPSGDYNPGIDAMQDLIYALTKQNEALKKELDELRRKSKDKDPK